MADPTLEGPADVHPPWNMACTGSPIAHPRATQRSKRGDSYSCTTSASQRSSRRTRARGRSGVARYEVAGVTRVPRRWVSARRKAAVGGSAHRVAPVGSWLLRSGRRTERLTHTISASTPAARSAST